MTDDAKEPMANDIPDSLSWGDKVVITEFGLWGNRCNTAEYAFSGAAGAWPETVYRFTRCGDSSIPIEKERFLDKFLALKDCVEGNKVVFILDKIIRRNKEPKP